MHSVADLMQKPITITEDSNLSDVIKKLLYHNISRIIVQNKNHPYGIVTEKDLGIFLFNDESNRSLEQIPLSEVVKKLMYVPGSTSVKTCSETMIERSIGSLGVGSDKGIEGILTNTDIIKYFAENYAGENKVVDIKNPGYISIPAEASLSDVIKKMLESKVSRIIVTSHEKEPIGIISFRDFFRISLQLGSNEDVTEAAVLSGSIRTGFLSENGFGGVSLARDVMTQTIISVEPDDDLAMACKVMLDNHVNGLVVRDNERRIGIVSKTDIVQLLALKD